MAGRQTTSPIDTAGETADIRGERRLRRAGMTGLATLFARGTAVAVNLITLPLTSHYLGRERFGVWLALSSLISWVVVVDFGLSNSLVNTLSSGADGRGDRRPARESVASAFWMVMTLAAFLAFVLIVAASQIEWDRLFGVGAALSGEIKYTAIVILLFCAFRLPTSLIHAVFLAYQEGYIYQIWSAAGGLLAALGLVLAIRVEAGLPGLALAFFSGAILADLFSAVYLFAWRHKWLLPKPGHFNPGRAVKLLKRGGQFWVAQMSAVLLLQTDLFIVTGLFGAAQVAVYGTTFRLLTLIGAIQMAFLFPFFASYGEALAKNDLAWVKGTYRRSIKISLLWAIPSSLLMVIAMPYLFSWLVTPEVRSDLHISIAIMVTEILNSVSRCMAIVLNGIGHLRTQVIIGPIGGIANIILSWELGKILGPAGVAWATAICLFVFWIVILGRDCTVRLRNLQD